MYQIEKSTLKDSIKGSHKLFKKDEILNICVGDIKSDNKLILNYTLLNTDIVDRWIKLVNKSNELNYKLRFNYRKIYSEDDIKEKFKKFRENILYINDNYDRVLTDIVNFDYLKENQNILNDLHEEFEIYGDRLEELISMNYFSNPTKFDNFYNVKWPGNVHNKILHEAFLLLNEQIHNFEAIYRNLKDPMRSLCTCLFDFIPAGMHEDLKPEDYFLFNPDHLWGWSYLGYNTLGKHWSSSCNDNDVEVVIRKQIRPQARFAAETYLNFSLHPPGYYTQINLYNWWLKNDFSKIINPDMKLKDLALGFIPTGKLHNYSINNENLVFITENIDKANFNKNVWSNFNTIESVKVIKL